MFQDPGTFWHVMVGERIIDHGLPTTDWLTFTRAGAPWIAHQWLTDVALAYLHRVGGFDALLCAVSATLAVVYSALFGRCVRAGFRPSWAALLCALAIMTSAGQFHVRPVIVTIVLFATVFATLVDVECGRKPMTALVWLAPLFVVWVNAHGGALGGIATVVLTVLVWCGSGWLRFRSPVNDRRTALLAGSAAVACCAATLVNPYGLDLLRAWRSIVTSPAIAALVIEHASVARSGSWHIMVLAGVFVGMIVLDRERFTTTRGVAAVWLLLACARVRNAPLFASAAALVVIEAIPNTRLWQRVRCDPPVDRRHRALASVTRALYAMPLVAIAFTAVLSHSGKRTGPAIVQLERMWPVELVGQLRSIQSQLGSGAPILNDERLGGFIEYFVPGFAVFSDDRYELFGDEFMRREQKGDEAWLNSWIASRRVRVALCVRGTALERHLSRAREWESLASSSSGVVLYRWRDTSPVSP